MYPTAEVRWFRSGPLPHSVEVWFRTHGPLAHRERARVDHYVHPAGHDGLNAKLRQGRLEIKRRTSVEGKRQFAEEAVGRVERWRKWSFSICSSAESGMASIATSADWVAVTKERLLKTYGSRASDKVSARPADEGCDMELTRVEALGQTWWTVALEAFGKEAALLANLVAVAEEALAPPCPVPLGPGDSRGYAGWLDALSREEGV